MLERLGLEAWRGRTTTILGESAVRSSWGISMVVASLVALPGSASAQEAETLIRGGIDSGGFGGPVLKFTEIDDQFGLLVGFRGGWIVDHTFVLGAGLYGLANTGSFDRTGPGGFRNRLFMGYGGLEMEWVISSHRVVHVSFQGLVGAGGVGFEDSVHGCCTDETADAFFIAEPGVNVMLNVHKVFRVGFGGSYRFVHDVDLAGLTDESLRGPAGTLTFKFGAF